MEIPPAFGESHQLQGVRLDTEEQLLHANWAGRTIARIGEGTVMNRIIETRIGLLQ